MKIEFRNVSKTFYGEDSELETLNNINIQIKEGEFVSIIGPSGCGKSTLLHLMTEIVDSFEGDILIEGISLKQSDKLVSYMHQKDLLMPWRTIKDNVTLPLILSGKKKKDAYKIVEPYYKMFGLDGFEEVYPNELSGGMRQRAALLRTFMVESDIMLFDEPFAAIDAINRHKLQQFLLERCQGFNRTIMFITHDIEEAIYLSDRIIVLSQRPATVIQDVKIELERPREKHMKLSVDFLKIKEMLIEALE
ncbi:MAG: ABC transporter ATP-binding protein [Clostridia bacterium]|nr:ABC transporter ATP-binding protein [Clostridia bacterium]